MHPDFHNIKLRGEINFKANIEELKSGVSYGDLTKAYVPKTPEEQAKVEARQQMTKEQLFTKLDHDVKEALIEFPNDEFICDIALKIKGKSSSVFKTKKELVEITTGLVEHVANLVADKEFIMYSPDDDSVDT